MTRNQTLFYATAKDLSGVLSSLEAHKDLQYTPAGLFDSKELQELQTYLSYRDIPDTDNILSRSKGQYCASRTCLSIRAEFFSRST